MRESLYDFCIANRKEALLRQWDREKNAPLTPSNVSQGSHKKVFWRCENNHVWNAAVYARTEGSGCPYCTGRKVMSDFNDLASVNPSLAAQWDSEKNAPLKPERVSVGSHRSVWWRCESGHSWRAVIRSRSAGCGCPYCTNKKVLAGFNDLATVEPRIAAEWHPTLNGALTPEMVTAGSTRRVWWECPLGHVWKAVIYSRTGAKKCGCPICAGKGKQKNVRYEEILAESAESSTAEGKADVQRI